MRTTLTLDNDLHKRITALAHRQQRSFKATLNETLRRGLAAQDPTIDPSPFVVRPHSGGLCQGIDPRRINQLLDEMEVDDFLAEAGLAPSK